MTYHQPRPTVPGSQSFDVDSRLFLSPAPFTVSTQWADEDSKQSCTYCTWPIELPVSWWEDSAVPSTSPCGRGAPIQLMMTVNSLISTLPGPLSFQSADEKTVLYHQYLTLWSTQSADDNIKQSCTDCSWPSERPVSWWEDLDLPTVPDSVDQPVSWAPS